MDKIVCISDCSEKLYYNGGKICSEGMIYYIRDINSIHVNFKANSIFIGIYEYINDRLIPYYEYIGMFCAENFVSYIQYIYGIRNKRLENILNG